VGAWAAGKVVQGQVVKVMRYAARSAYARAAVVAFVHQRPPRGASAAAACSTPDQASVRQMRFKFVRGETKCDPRVVKRCMVTASNQAGHVQAGCEGR